MSTVQLTSDAVLITAGQSITFNVVIPVADIPDPFLASFAGGYALFRSGDDYSAMFATMDQTGGGDVTFTYMFPGDYTASANGQVNYVTFCGPFHQSCPGVGAGTMNFIVTEAIAVVADPPALLQVSASVPEPATWGLLLTGALIAACARRCWRRPSTVR